MKTSIKNKKKSIC